MISAGRTIAALLSVLSFATAPLGPPAQERHTGIELDRVVPGATSAHLREAFGEPRLVENDHGAAFPREDYALVSRGYAHVTAWFDPNGGLLTARILLVNQLKPAAAALLFDLRSGASRTEGHDFAGTEDGHFVHYDREGVHFFVLEGRVREIWRTQPWAVPANLRVALAASYPARPLLEVPSTDEDSPLEDRSIEQLFEELIREGVATEVPPPAGPPVRSLSLEKPVASIVLDDQRRPLLAITAVVLAEGLRDEEIRFEGFLRPYPASLTGAAPLRASANAPSALRDAGGSLHPWSTDRVLYDSSRFGTPTLFFPLPYVEGYDRNFSGHFQASFEATCGGLAAFDAVVAIVPGPRLGDVGPIPTLIAGALRVEAGQVENLGDGLWVYRDVHATQARGRQVSTYLTLRRTDGRHVLSAPGWEAWRLDDGRFFSLAKDEALYDDSSWTPFRTFVPLGSLALEPGEHRLILRAQTSIQALGGAHEREITITIPLKTASSERSEGDRR